METRFLELAIDARDFSAAILPRELPRLFGPSSGYTGLLVGIILQSDMPVKVDPSFLVPITRAPNLGPRATGP